MKRLVLIIAVLALFQGCSATTELKQARIDIDRRVESYSKLTGPAYRTPPKEISTAEELPAVPANTVLSWSALTGEWTNVPAKTPRLWKASPAKRKASQNLGVSYSPLTGEAVVIKPY